MEECLYSFHLKGVSACQRSQEEGTEGTRLCRANLGTGADSSHRLIKVILKQQVYVQQAKVCAFQFECEQDTMEKK